MLPLIRREINSFFSSSIGYLVISLFLIFNGLLLWVFTGTFNILDAGFADLTAFFQLAPWVLLFLIPAVTMRSFSDEKKMGTLELLLTKPISILTIVMAKYTAAVMLIGIALVPTLTYILTISNLGSLQGNFDLGSTFGSYIGLLFLVLSYVAIGIFASTLSSNQIVAFIIAVFICFALYFGFEGATDLLGSSIPIQNFGMKAHFESTTRGILDTRDLLYFLSISSFFVLITVFKLRTDS